MCLYNEIMTTTKTKQNTGSSLHLQSNVIIHFKYLDF